MCQIPVKQLMWVTAWQREDQLPNPVNQTINSWLVIIIIIIIISLAMLIANLK